MGASICQKCWEPSHLWSPQGLQREILLAEKTIAQRHANLFRPAKGAPGLALAMAGWHHQQFKTGERLSGTRNCPEREPVNRGQISMTKEQGNCADWQRDQIWNNIYDIHFDCFYQELVSRRCALIWRVVDVVCKILIATTISGLAISAWPLWGKPGFRLVWSLLAAMGALAGIIDLVFSPLRREYTWLERERGFNSLRLSCEQIRSAIRQDSVFEINLVGDQVMQIQRQYTQRMALVTADFIPTRKQENAVQDDVERRLTGRSRNE